MAMSIGTKSGFAGFFRSLFGWSRGDAEACTSEADTETHLSAAPTTFGSPVVGRPGVPANCIQIPLASVINSLPLELRGRVKNPNVGNACVTVPHSIVLAQLPQGAVKVAFSEIRKAARSAFVPGRECDQVPVTLPLIEIVSRLNPALLMRKPAQRQILVSQDVSSPFESAGQAFGSVAAAQEAGLGSAHADYSMKAAPVTTVPPTAATVVATPGIPAPVIARPVTVRLVAAPPATKAPVAPTPVNYAPVAPRPLKTVAVPQDIPDTFTIKPRVNAAQPAAPVPPVAAPTRAASPVVPSPGFPNPVVRMVNPPAAPTRPAAVPERAVILVQLSALAQAWPEFLCEEIVKCKLEAASVALPVDLVEASLKRGGVVFQWKTLRSWIRPVPAVGASAHDGAEVELPLNVLAPLFLRRRGAAQHQQARVELDEAIPNLFFGFPKPDVPAAAQPSDTNVYVFDDHSDSARVDQADVKKPPTKTEFLGKFTTPNELVARATSLENVAGALIALPDGLMVAGQVPPELNAEAIAALLPQVFAKVRQCTQELRMGELNNVNFTLGNVPWKIFRVNAVFFAAFGLASQPLPASQLAALAAELDHKHK